ncbi:MAG: hypothetical protein ACI8ZM_001065 [Crocinitomix sp.]|jgi:hypothetical protein
MTAVTQGAGSSISSATAFGGGMKLLSFAFSVYSSIETNKYRNYVKEQLRIIETELTELSNEVISIEKNAVFWTVWGQYGDPIVTIDDKFSDHINGRIVKKSDEFVKVSSAMQSLYDSICGSKHRGFALDDSILQYYLEAIRTKPLKKSLIESAYSYYQNVLIMGMVKGFSMLVEYGNTEEEKRGIKKWHDDIMGTNKSKGSSYLEKMATACENVIDKLEKNHSPMVGFNVPMVSLANGFTNSLASITIEQSFIIPTGNVVLGVNFVQGGKNTLHLEVYHGEFLKNGYAKNSKKALSEGGQVICWNPTPTKVARQPRFLDSLRKEDVLNPKVTQVIIDVKLRHLDVLQQKGAEPVHFYWFSIKYAEVNNDGTINYDSAHWVDENPDPRTSYSETWITFVPFWEQWISESELGNLTIPITGLQVIYGLTPQDGSIKNKTRLLFKSDIHRNCFKY